MVPSLFADRYYIVKQIDKGSFGNIYLAIDKKNSLEKVAVKIESCTTRTPQLLHESKAYNILRGGVGIPQVRWFGQETGFNALVMDLLGPSLESLLNRCSRHFTPKTVLMLADQMVSRLQFVHSKTLIHGDVKPDNFVMGTGIRQNQVFLIDFGLSQHFRRLRTNQYVRYRDDMQLSGTARYASINALQGIRQSRRDDMESLGYVLIYFLKGKLPWQGLCAETRKQKHEKISEMKKSISSEMLCHGCPLVFSQYLNYCRKLDFYEEPSYDHMREMFRISFRSLNFEYDWKFDWTVPDESAKGSTGSPGTCHCQTPAVEEKCSNCTGGHSNDIRNGKLIIGETKISNNTRGQSLSKEGNTPTKPVETTNVTKDVYKTMY